MSNVYSDGSYLAANPTWHVEDSAWKAQQVLKMLERNSLHPRSIVEVGCGAGAVLASLHEQLPDHVTFTGCDVSPNAIALARQRQRYRLAFHQGEIPLGQFDLLLAMDVLEHVPDYIGFLSGLKSKATHHIFHIPLDMNVQMVLRAGRIMTTRTEAGHLHYFSKETALAALREAGYEIRDFFYTQGVLDLPGRSKLAKWPRWLAFKLHQDLAARLLGGFSLLVLTRQIETT